MHVITHARISEAADKWPRHAEQLDAWYRLMKHGTFENYGALLNTFRGVDKVGNKIVFNVAGNHLRIITAVHFDRRKVFIRAVLDHREYDEKKWMS